MCTEIIADVTEHEARVALLEDGRLAELQVELRGRERLVGNIYKGRVQNVLPGMQAAFVDIGLDKNAFLYVGDILVDKNDFDFENDKGTVAKEFKDINIKDIVSRRNISCVVPPAVGCTTKSIGSRQRFGNGW